MHTIDQAPRSHKPSLRTERRRRWRRLSRASAAPLVVTLMVSTLIALVAPSSQALSGPLVWTAAAPMPTARGRVGLATDSAGTVYVFGGEDATHIGLSTVERYDPVSVTWSSRAPMPTPLTGVRPIRANDGKIYVIGGANPSLDTASVVNVYDPAADAWAPRQNLPVKALGAAGALGPDGKIYVFGGYPGCCFSYNNTVFAYDVAADTWTARSPMPTARESAGAALATDGKIYVAGGNGNGNTNTAFEAYDPVANTWATKAPIPGGMDSVSLMSAADGKLYILGRTDGAVLAYDPAANTWAISTTLPDPRYSMQATLAGNGRIYVIGGRQINPDTSPGAYLATTDQGSFGSTDVTPPTIALSSPADGSSYVVGQPATLTFTCQDEAGGSGLASCTATVDGSPITSGAALPVGTSGKHTIVVSATDQAGNPAQLSRSYAVFAAWSGPVDAPPAVNTVNAGAGVPVVFKLPGNKGLTIFDASYPQSQVVNCQDFAGAPTDPVESTVSTPGGLTYDATSDTYTYVWKTTKSWAGTCRRLILKFAPAVPGYGGAQAGFNFKFK